MEYGYRTMPSPVGELKLVAKGTKLVAILWEDDNPKRIRLGAMFLDESNPTLLETERQLNEYFRGERTRFELDYEFQGTAFQKSVWDALMAIPFGETRTYRQIAAQLGNPNSTRAVGAANGKNPLSIVTPCHRLIGSAGDLRGFAGGLDTKARLIALESGQTDVFYPKTLFDG